MGNATVNMDFARASFYDAPFPSDDLVKSDGTIDLGGFPNPNAIALVTMTKSMAASAHGFAEEGAVFFTTTAEVPQAALPTMAATVTAGASVFVMDVQPGSPDYLQRVPLKVQFETDGGPYGAPNLLSVLPMQGVPLRPTTRYAVVITTALKDTNGKALGAMTAFQDGARPGGISDAGFATYQAALGALGAAHVDVSTVAGLAAFTTGAPTRELGKVVSAMLASPPAPAAPFTPNEVFDTYCVFSTTIPMPDYQAGTPPYTSAGGAWVFDASGNPVLQEMQPANFVVTVPRQTMPAAGYPIVVLSRTGAGGNRPLVDRGQMATNGGPAITAGTGPALYYANVGFAGSEIDGPLGGLRNPDPSDTDEDFTIFNVGNPIALRDNIRESAAELALQAHILESISIDVSSCPGAVAPNNTATFDVDHMALMGHSMGATISPLALAFEPRFKVGLLSGAGGSMIENVMYKLLPLPILGTAEVLVGVAGSGYALTANDPLLSMFQWATEPADPPVYGRLITTEPAGGTARNVLMMQGVVDHYIMPPIANATSLSMSLDLAGQELDDQPSYAINYVLEECGCGSSGPCYEQCTDDCTNPAPFVSPTDPCGTCLAGEMKKTTSACTAVSAYTPVGSLLPLVGSTTLTLPATQNLTVSGGSKTSAILTQNLGDGIEDGHEVVFQTDGPKHQYGCFLKGMLSGTPTVPTPGTAFAACN